ncbi:coiled-coil domain-containing protein 34 [Drosophila madeirensis]|uniref:Coiled-coil domain-containing protein 34 n=1 Tax=Drosophila madeirensis TaxID=30013 RepID=A0AAU9FCX4_DROMD
MAFLGRLNNRGVLINWEIFSGNRSWALKSPPNDDQSEESVEKLPLAKGSRTYIKTYDDGKTVSGMGSPSTVRYVGKFISATNGNSTNERDVSTPRYCAAQETETEAETLPEEDGRSSYNSSQYEDSQAMGDLMLDKDSTTSECSWDEIISKETSSNPSMADDPCVSIPSLNIRSQTETETESEGYSPTYSQTIKALKLERPVKEAYDTWLSAKRQQKQYKAQAERRKEVELKKNIAERQKMAKDSYERWCAAKFQQKSASSSKTSLKSPPNKPVQNKSKSASAPRLDAAAQRRLQEWEMEKVKQAEKRRMQQQREAARLHQETLLRHKQADEAFEKWMQNVSQRPKPVPLNQGLASLRGTVSELYINPNEWVD